MTKISGKVYLSAIDKERFDIPTARATFVTRETLSTVIDFCNSNKVVLLIARCLASELEAAQEMQRENFLLMDTLVYYTQNLVKTPIPADNGRVMVRPVRLGEENDVKMVAAAAFRGYFGHYHADKRLDRVKCDETYASWAYRSCVSREVADDVLVADLDSSIVGFTALRLNNPKEGEGVLNGVVPFAQRRGIYRSLMIRGMEWCLSKGAARMVISTQVTNLAAQKVWTRLGFELSHAYYTFHKWFDEP